MAHRTFTVPQPTTADGPTFTLADQSFVCIKTPPAGVLSALVSAVGTDDRGNRVFNQVDILAFIEGVLRERRWAIDHSADSDKPGGHWEPTDDVARFHELMFSKDVMVPIELLGEIVVWLSQEYMPDRPIAPSAS